MDPGSQGSSWSQTTTHHKTTGAAGGGFLSKLGQVPRRSPPSRGQRPRQSTWRASASTPAGTTTCWTWGSRPTPWRAVQRYLLRPRDRREHRQRRLGNLEPGQRLRRVPPRVSVAQEGEPVRRPAVGLAATARCGPATRWSCAPSAPRCRWTGWSRSSPPTWSRRRSAAPRPRRRRRPRDRGLHPGRLADGGWHGAQGSRAAATRPSEPYPARSTSSPTARSSASAGGGCSSILYEVERDMAAYRPASPNASYADDLDGRPPHPRSHLRARPLRRLPDLDRVPGDVAQPLGRHAGPPPDRRNLARPDRRRPDARRPVLHDGHAQEGAVHVGHPLQARRRVRPPGQPPDRPEPPPLAGGHARRPRHVRHAGQARLPNLSNSRIAI